jgi:hypothetical protein
MGVNLDEERSSVPVSTQIEDETCDGSFSGRENKVIKHQQSTSHRAGEWWKKNKLFLLVVVVQ